MDQKTLDKLLFNALNKNDVEGIKKALEKGANGNAVTKKGTTPLMIVSKMNHNMMPKHELADLLIESGADVNYVNKKDFTVISNLMKSAAVDLSMIKHLIENHGADVNQTVKIKQDGELKTLSLLDFAYMNSIDPNLVKLLKDKGAKSLSESDLKEGFEFRYNILDQGFKESGIYDIIEEAKKCGKGTSEKIPELLSRLSKYVTEEKYLKGNDYLADIEDLIHEHGKNEDRLIFLYLKASILIYLNSSISSLKNEIEELLDKKQELKWDFSISRETIENSGLREEIKEKLIGLTNIFKKR